MEKQEKKPDWSFVSTPKQEKLTSTTLPDAQNISPTEIQPGKHPTSDWMSNIPMLNKFTQPDQEQHKVDSCEQVVQDKLALQQTQKVQPESNTNQFRKQHESEAKQPNTDVTAMNTPEIPQQTQVESQQQQSPKSVSDRSQRAISDSILTRDGYYTECYVVKAGRIPGTICFINLIDNSEGTVGR